jgi:hypothetical protein
MAVSGIGAEHLARICTAKLISPNHPFGDIGDIGEMGDLFNYSFL